MFVNIVKPMLPSPAGTLQPLEILEEKWDFVCMDGVHWLKEGLMRFTCALLKMAHFMPTTATMTIESTIQGS